MSTAAESIVEILLEMGDAEKVSGVTRFFKAEKGGYAEGDQFLGISVPQQRAIAKKHYKEIELAEVVKLLKNPFHEVRLTALFFLVYQYEKESIDEQEKIVRVYLQNVSSINNWDLVDSSADKILGAWLYAHPKKEILYKLAVSDNLWERRISIIASFYFIRKKVFTDALAISKILLNDKHDLIHKAVGWMLREIGNRDFEAAFEFLKQHYAQMPRTMLRYAIEKFEETLRQKFLKGMI